MHILGNMVFFWAFAPVVEDGMGRGRFLGFYLLGGVVAFAAQIAVDPTSTIPNLGASGAIAAVMGAFLVRYPHDRIKNTGADRSFPDVDVHFRVTPDWPVVADPDAERGGLARGYAVRWRRIRLAHRWRAVWRDKRTTLFKASGLGRGGPPWEPTTRFGRHLYRWSLSRQINQRHASARELSRRYRRYSSTSSRRPPRSP